MSSSWTRRALTELSSPGAKEPRQIPGAAHGTFVSGVLGAGGFFAARLPTTRETRTHLGRLTDLRGGHQCLTAHSMGVLLEHRRERDAVTCGIDPSVPYPDLPDSLLGEDARCRQRMGRVEQERAELSCARELMR